MPGARASIGITHERSLAFAAPHSSPQPQSGDSWEPVAIGPGRSAPVGSARNGNTGEVLTQYPIQPSKVQRPSLRDDTLPRGRLLDWLASRIHDRVILLLADAGYGKSTLLADFSERTRLRTMWYRLDEDDRDWIAFINYLVAAGREHDPGFAPTTASMMQDLAVGEPARDAVIDVFLRELPSVAEQGVVLILDDFHAVDESPDIRLIMRELIARAPDRMTFVFASRRSPTIPLARLRASGEVAELGTDDLRFDIDETRRLFSETYGRTLEPDVLADVAARTEGWAASLQLVQAALRDRSPAEIRRFVRGLNGADPELYDYLAEEVVGDLPEDLQQFLMRTSILQSIDPGLAAIAAGIDEAEVARLTGAAERLTLLSRPSRTSPAPQRYHPLVREFLEARLGSVEGLEAVAHIQRRVAEAAARTNWRTAAFHYRQAGDSKAVSSVISDAVAEIMGSGQYAVAIGFVDQLSTVSQSAALNLIRSRVAMQSGDRASAIALSRAVLLNAVPGSQESDHAMLNLAAAFMHAGETEPALANLEGLRTTTREEELRLIADGMRLMIAADGNGDLNAVSRHLLGLAERQRGTHQHYFGVSMLNLAVISILRDEPGQAIDHARQAIEALEGTSSRIEISAAYMANATALMMLGQAEQADQIAEYASAFGQIEATLERADMLDSYGDPEHAWELLDSVEGRIDLNLIDRFSLGHQLSRYHLRRGEHTEASARLPEFRPVQTGAFLGQAIAALSTAAYVAVAVADQDRDSKVSKALKAAKTQGAQQWRRVLELLRASYGSNEDLAATIKSVGKSSPWNITFVADIIALRLDDLDAAAIAFVGTAAQLHPGRWRFVLRQLLGGPRMDSAINAARLLESIGERSDIKMLRSFSRRHRRLPGASALGRGLARQLADRVFVEDLNRVSIHIGARQVAGSTIRRKVLALMCFLLTRPDLSSTRDQVLDALWPDLDPLDAVNSLNQTVYFLRRILEEEYVDDLSPGYLHHDSDLIWFDRDLVTSRSNECRRLIKVLPSTPSPDQVFGLAEQYAGKFALDFDYEEWATPYRDWLHASFLDIVERAVTSDIETGHFDRGIRLARRVLDVDPNAEQVELSLLRLYRASGAHTAAAEQYGHYAAVVRDQLGIEPPSLESL
jgi:LuxR family transcriptional regulator, maltose regulon positive regulatory protein